MHSPFRKLLHGSLGSIPLLPRYFISAGFSPPAANFYFARRQPHLGFVHLAASIAHSSLISQSIAKVHLHSSATFVPCGKFTSVASYVVGIAFVPHALLPPPLWGLAVRLHFVVPPYSGGRKAARNPCSADKCAARPCFFFAAGAFTGRNTKTKGNQTDCLYKDEYLVFYSSTTLAPGAFDFTDSIPLSLPEDDSYISLVPIIWPFDALRLK